MPATRTTSIVVANLSTAEKYFDHFESEMHTDTSGNNRVAVIDKIAGAWNGGPFSDDFNRTNESPLNAANWTVPAGGAALQVVSNACESTAADSVWHQELYTGVSWQSDQYSEVAVVASTGSDRPVAVIVRGSTGALTYYHADVAFLGAGTATIRLWKRASGTFSQIGSSVTGQTVNAGDVLRLEVVGTQLTVKLNGVTKISQSNADISSGAPGLSIFVPTAGALTSAVVDSWSGGSLPGRYDQRGIYYFQNAVIGTTYQFRFRVIDKAGNAGAWSGWISEVAGDSAAPSSTYLPVIFRGFSRTFLSVTVTNPASDVDHYEFYYQATPIPVPSSTAAPNLPDSRESSPRVSIFVDPLNLNGYVYIWIRAVDTSGNRQAWTQLWGWSKWLGANACLERAGTKKFTANAILKGPGPAAPSPGGTLDDVDDGTTFGRPLRARLVAGRPFIDFAEAENLNKHLGNIADDDAGTGRRSLVKGSSTKLNDQGNIPAVSFPASRFTFDKSVVAGDTRGVVKLTWNNFTIRRADGGSISIIKSNDSLSIPSTPTLAQVAVGSLAARTYFVRIALVINQTLCGISAEASLAVSANNVLKVTSPSSVTGYNGWIPVISGTGNPASSGSTNAEKIHIEALPSAPIAFGTDWTEPTTGLTDNSVSGLWSEDNALAAGDQGPRAWTTNANGKLAASTSYFVYPYLQIMNTLISFVDAMNVAKTDVAAAEQCGDGNVSLSLGAITITMPASGGSGSNTGGEPGGRGTL